MKVRIGYARGVRDHNPYRPQPGSEPPALIGRERELSVIEATLRAARQGGSLRPTVLTGLRGMGKTALLRRSLAMARDDGAVVLEIEASPDVPLAVALADGLAAAKQHVSVSARIRAILDGLRRAMPSAALDLPHDMGSIELTLRGTDGVVPLRTALDDLNSAVRSRGLYLVIAIDEIQEAAVGDLREIIKVVHASAGTQAPIVFLGAGLTNSAERLHEARTYTERWRYPRLECLSAEQAAEAIRLPAQARGVIFESAALDRLAGETAGYPFFIQEYASVVWMGTEGPVIRSEAVERIVPGVQADLDEQFYALRFNRLTPREVLYALALADLGDGPHPVHTVAAVFNARSQDISSVRNQLIKKEVLFASAPGLIEFRMPLSARYVQRNRAALDLRARGVSLLKPGPG
jgi:hypothetical protein